MLKNLWLFRYFIWSSVRSDLISRFARSKLGALWTILNPLAQVAMYALILSNLLAAKLSGIENKYAYAIYLMSGLLAWTLFSEILSRCLNLFVEQANLIKKVHFPRITLPTIVVVSSLLNNILLFAATILIFLILGHRFDSLMILALLPMILLLLVFSVGLGLILGVLNVFVRDLGQVVPILLQIWFWFTPIVYPLSIVPEQYRYLLNYNPLFHFTNAYQELLVFSKLPDTGGLFVVGVATIFLVYLSLYIFRKANEELVDVL